MYPAIIPHDEFVNVDIRSRWNKSHGREDSDRECTENKGNSNANQNSRCPRIVFRISRS